MESTRKSVYKEALKFIRDHSKRTSMTCLYLPSYGMDSLPRLFVIGLGDRQISDVAGSDWDFDDDFDGVVEVSIVKKDMYVMSDYENDCYWYIITGNKPLNTSRRDIVDEDTDDDKFSREIGKIEDMFEGWEKAPVVFILSDYKKKEQKQIENAEKARTTAIMKKISKIEQQRANVPSHMRGRKSSPKRNCRFSRLENSVRRMF